MIKPFLFKGTYLKRITLAVSCVLSTVSIAGTAVHLKKYHVTNERPWVISQDLLIDQLVIDAGARILRPGKAITLLVAGKEVPIKAGTYQNAQLRVSDKFGQNPAGNTPRGVDNFRTALYVDESGIDNKKSIVEAIAKGQFSDTTARNLTITSSSDNFNGVMINGPVNYTISDSTFDFTGNGDGSEVSDFSGFGAAIAAYNDAKVTINNTNIITAGVARLALFSFAGSDVLVQDSNFTSLGGELYPGYENSADFSLMVAPPWVLGITGTARTTNMMGNTTTFTLVNSTVKAANWGVVSTDLGAAMLLTIVDSELELTGEKDIFSKKYGSGYGTYILGSEQFYYGVTVKAGTYGGIIRNGYATYGASDFSAPLNVYPKIQIDTGKTEKDIFGNDRPVFIEQVSKDPIFTNIPGKGKHSVILSDNFGWMSHGNGGLTLTDGTRAETGSTMFLFKDGNITLTLEDNVELLPANGILIQLMDSDDRAVGLQQDTGLDFHFNTSFSEPVGYPGLDFKIPEPTTEMRSTVNATATNVNLTGDVFNATGYMNGQAGDILNLTLANKATLTGQVSATSAIHVDEHGKQKARFNSDEYYYLGHIANKPFDNGANHINLTLKTGATWNVTSTSLLNSLQLEEGASVVGKNGTLTMTVNGKTTRIKPGKYQGNIILRVE
ncbi:hypothetical protein J3369_10345 [Alteromonas sp. NFXS44]|uniref:hypothetical protein n=1 Tax=Alteromonas sp. NFXS44 TaxID=2818435 RepID=UPI0032E034EE